MTEMEVKKIATIVMGILFAGVVLGILLVSIYFSNVRKLLVYIQNNYRNSWVKLGAPALFMDMSPANSIRTIRFIFSPESYDDPQIKKLKSKAKTSLVIFIVYFIVMLILVIALPILVATGQLRF